MYKLLEQRADHNREKLDNLPEGVGGQIRELMEYDFIDPEAQQKFQELLDMLKRQMAQNLSQQMSEQIQGMTPEQMAAMREMLNQLNQMMRDRMQGREPDFEGFMQQFGPMFGDNPPQSFDELMERMQQRLGQMQSLMESMSPEMRQEMEQALSSVVDPETQRAMAEFASLMEQLMPMDDLRRQYPFLGDDSLTMEQAMELMRQLQEQDQLEEALQQAMRTGNLEDVDPEKLAELLGEEARRAWEQLDRLRQLLQQAGYVTSDDKMELTARGIRRIGQKALQEVFAHLKKDRVGAHQMDSRGANGDLLGDTKQYEFGDPFQLDLQTTVKNAILRVGARSTGAIGTPELRNLPSGAHDQGIHGGAVGPEPVNGPVQQLRGGQEGHLGLAGPYPHPVSPGHFVHHRIFRLCQGDQRRGHGQCQLELLGFGH